MFGNKEKARYNSEKQAKIIGLKLIPIAGLLARDRNETQCRGFDVRTLSGKVLYPSDSGPVIERLFYFRLAGASLYTYVNNLDGVLGQEVIVMQERNDSHDAIRIRVLHRGYPVGYVPTRLAPSMLPHLIPTKVLGGQDSGTMGMVAKTYHRRGKVVGAELLAVARGYGITATN